MAFPLPIPLSITPLTLLALTTFLTYTYIIHPLLISALSKIPAAHPTAPISPLWITWQRYRMRNNRTVYEAHERLGPIVRLGPNEVSINCVEGGLRTVYAGGFEKHEWYPRLFKQYGTLSMFSTSGHQPHSTKKRMISNVYSKSYLQSSAQIAENSSILLKERFLPFIQRRAMEGTEFDVHDMNNGFTMDFMSAYQYGLPNSTQFSVDEPLRKRLLHRYHCRKDYEFHAQEVPWLAALSEKVGWPVVPRFVSEANVELEEWNIKMCDGAEQYLGEIESPGAEPVVYKHFKSGLQRHMVKAGRYQSPRDVEQARFEVASEMLDHLGAGHETSAVALTYLYWELSQRPQLQDKLREELLSLSPQVLWPPQDGSTADKMALPHPKWIDALPLLHATLMETLRLHAPIPGIEPRITPAGGCTLAGYENIPANVRVSAMPYALHRNPEVFPDPESWLVDRWLKPAESLEMKEMMRWFWAFGSGGRMCIGNNLAMQEMKLLVAAIYSNYKTSIVDDEGIEELDAYTTKPMSNRLILRFEHV